MPAQGLADFSYALYRDAIFIDVRNEADESSRNTMNLSHRIILTRKTVSIPALHIAEAGVSEVRASTELLTDIAHNPQAQKFLIELISLCLRNDLQNPERR